MNWNEKLIVLSGLTGWILFITQVGNFNFNFFKPNAPGLEKTIVFVSEIGLQPKKFEKLEVCYESEDYKPKYYAVVNKNELEGIADIRELARKSLNLESWVYISSQNLWVETGGMEKTYDLWFNMRDMIFGAPPNITGTELINSDRLESLLTVNSEANVYSFLPDPRPSLNQAIGIGLDPEGNLEKIKFEWEMRYNLPNGQVIASMLNRASIFREMWPEGNLTQKICNVYGVFECKLKGMKLEGDLNQFLPNIWNLKNFDFSQYFGNSERALKAACEIASDEYVQFSFKTYEELGL